LDGVSSMITLQSIAASDLDAFIDLIKRETLSEDMVKEKASEILGECTDGLNQKLWAIYLLKRLQ
jgi:hypothetical protein